MDPTTIARLRVAIRGIVQGVGFRPFVHRLAHELALTGWVRNTGAGVLLEVEGPRDHLNQFLLRLDTDKPVRASIQGIEPQILDPLGYAAFAIRPSTAEGTRGALVSPDIATCADCLAEIRDPANRRHRYPFTNCTHCGPRYSILQRIPYDRPHTTMRAFNMCGHCRAEYDDPLDRRFHAQPNACPVCGPRLTLLTPDGGTLATDEAALQQAINAIRTGHIVAVKGLGGFHLIVDATDAAAVQRLRDRKSREEKPFALMYPDIAGVERDSHVEPLEQRLLRSPEAPIVLLRRRADSALNAAIAPANPFLGVMLPYTPLHHLLLDGIAGPVVATSGNRRDEPIAIDTDEALRRLAGLADLFLVHDRPIARPLDDSIARIILGRELILRRARGYAPLPVPLHYDLAPTLAVGAHLKNTVALAAGRDVFLSPHIGDLETAQACDAFLRQTADLPGLFEQSPVRIACDLHPDYRSSRFAADAGLPVVAVQHHHAHVIAGMADNGLDGTVLGVAWDGTGLGTDHAIWGGEFLAATLDDFTRVGHWRAFPLPGGDAAAREPRRAALGLLHAAGRLDDPRALHLPFQASFTASERETLHRMLERHLNCPATTSAGRLFDAIAALLNLRQKAAYEGQAAMLLEFEASRAALESDDIYPVTCLPPPLQGDIPSGPTIIDWGPMLDRILTDLAGAVPVPTIAARFHNTLVEAIVMIAKIAAIPRVVLTGGCFQNRYLLEHAVKALNASGFKAYWHQRVPPNDGGVALGQAVLVGRRVMEN